MVVIKMTEQYTPCKYEKPLNSHLVLCRDVLKPYNVPQCPYRKFYNTISYCKRKVNFRDAELTFLREKKAMLERAVDGEEYHERNTN